MLAYLHLAENEGITSKLELLLWCGFGKSEWVGTRILWEKTRATQCQNESEWCSAEKKKRAAHRFRIPETTTIRNPFATELGEATAFVVLMISSSLHAIELWTSWSLTCCGRKFSCQSSSLLVACSAQRTKLSRYPFASLSDTPASPADSHHRHRLVSEMVGFVRVRRSEPHLPLFCCYCIRLYAMGVPWPSRLPTWMDGSLIERVETWGTGAKNGGTSVREWERQPPPSDMGFRCLSRSSGSCILKQNPVVYWERRPWNVVRTKLSGTWESRIFLVSVKYSWTAWKTQPNTRNDFTRLKWIQKVFSLMKSEAKVDTANHTAKQVPQLSIQLSGYMNSSWPYSMGAAKSYD